MAAAVVFVQWDSLNGWFARDPLSYNSRQARLHDLGTGDQLWLVSRCPADQQYYFVAVLQVDKKKHNPPGSREAELFGDFGIVAERSKSWLLNQQFPAEGFLRAFQFESGRPIRHGASIGQSLQTIRFLDRCDKLLLDTCLGRIHSDRLIDFHKPFGLWTKCDIVFVDYFLTNWTERKAPVAFLLFDPPPALMPGSLVFVHASAHLRFVASYCGSQYISGQKFTVESNERKQERERIWTAYRADTIDAPTKPEFEKFFDAENGVRSVFFMDQLHASPDPCPSRDYMRALEWGFPRGVGYRYLSLAESYLLLRSVGLPEEIRINLARNLVAM
jgi:hypothetical protein